MAPFRITALLLAVAIAASPALSQEATQKADKEQSPQSRPAFTLPDDSVTQHTLGEGPSALDYTATAGSLPMKNDKGETTANVFYAAYTVSGENRPISFVFNGGPGAASAFLHLCALGPRVLNYQADGATPVKPIKLSDNPDSWLPFTDLVFVDPVGTGFSRTTGDVDAKKAYYGVDADARSMTDFVRLYLTRSGRELADIYVVGESYGGFRAAHVAHRLLEGGMQVAGAILISPALEFSMIRGDEYALVPLALQLPSIAASRVERTHGYGASFEEVRAAESFARTNYLVQLVQGLEMDEATRARLSKLTGLSPDVIDRHHGRIDASLYRRQFKRDENRAISVYDGSVSAPLPRPAGRQHLDPILDSSVATLTPLMVKYARDELGFKTDVPYELLNRELNREWDYGTKPNRQGFAGSLDELQEARTLNPQLKVFISHGYTDLATPYSVSDFLIDQLSPIETARPIDFRVYRGGHMMYMRPASRSALTKDARAIYGEQKAAAD